MTAVQMGNDRCSVRLDGETFVPLQAVTPMVARIHHRPAGEITVCSIVDTCDQVSIVDRDPIVPSNLELFVLLYDEGTTRPGVVSVDPIAPDRGLEWSPVCAKKTRVRNTNSNRYLQRSSRHIVQKGRIESVRSDCHELGLQRRIGETQAGNRSSRRCQQREESQKIHRFVCVRGSLVPSRRSSHRHAPARGM